MTALQRTAASIGFVSVPGGPPVVERVAGPKEFVELDTGHFGPYDEAFAPSSQAAVRWFRQHLL